MKFLSEEVFSFYHRGDWNKKNDFFLGKNSLIKGFNEDLLIDLENDQRKSQRFGKVRRTEWVINIFSLRSFYTFELKIQRKKIYFKNDRHNNSEI